MVVASTASVVYGTRIEWDFSAEDWPGDKLDLGKEIKLVYTGNLERPLDGVSFFICIHDTHQFVANDYVRLNTEIVSDHGLFELWNEQIRDCLLLNKLEKTTPIGWFLLAKLR